MSESDEVRVRFAPSPTGELHVGGARTALYNWLLARRHEGSFILRIEDTDEERSSEEHLESILGALTWLGLDWDEGPIHQADRMDLYRDYVSLLMNSGHAYYCFATQEELEELRAEAEETRGESEDLPDEADGESEGEGEGEGEGESEGAREDNKPKKANWVYRGKDRDLSADEVREKLENDEPHTVRFKVPDEGGIVVKDLVQGEVKFDPSQIEDFVLLRSDDSPTYHLSNVVDDIEMGITHVVRGADHLSNTPKQILVYEALNANLPEFAHLPLILGGDGKRLSKRHGATSVEYFRDKGYLPGAVVNYLALLGWNTGDDREVFTMTDLTREFALEDVNKSNPKFDLDKLQWLNGEYISQVPAGELRLSVRDALRIRGCWQEELDMERRDYFFALIQLWQSRSHTINELADNIAPFLTEAFAFQPDALKEHVHKKEMLEPLEAWRARILQTDPWDQETLEADLREVAEEQGREAKELIHATRVALTGKKVSPGIFEVMELMGRDRSRVRFDRMIRYLRKLKDAAEKREEQLDQIEED